MKIKLNPVVIALCLSGLVSFPVYAYAQSTTTKSDASQMGQLSSETKSLESQLAKLQSQMKSLQSQLNNKQMMLASADSQSTDSTYVSTHSTDSRHHSHVAHKGKVYVQPAPAASVNTASGTGMDGTYTPTKQNAQNLMRLINEEKQYLPFDLDVPGQAFVSTGPYIGVPFQYSGSDLVVNSPSVNIDVQLLNIRKSILKQLNMMGGEIFKEPYHSHLLFSGVVEGQANYADYSGPGNSGNPRSNIDVTNVSLDALFLGPSDWTLGFIEFSYDNNPPIGSVYTSTSNYTDSNSRVFVNKAFVTVGDFAVSPWYGTFGQDYVPFGQYSSVMVSDVLTKLLTRTKARSILLGFQQQDPNAFYAAGYIFRGDSHAAAVQSIDNGGVNVGYKYNLVDGFYHGNIGAGVIGNIADSGGMQVGNGFNANEQIVHRVPGYNLRGILSFGEHWDFIGEYVGASTRFNPNDMSFQAHGAKPYAVDTEASYSFMVACNKPSSIGVGYETSRQALSLGLPMNRYSLVFNTSWWRNTLESLEFRRDLEYPASNVASGGGAIASAPETGKFDNVVTAQFDYYF